MSDLYLTPLTGTILVVLVAFCGHRFRKAWKEQDEGWQTRAWLFGVPAMMGLLALGFVPLKF
ncbi:hypothetical protein [Shimia sp. SDUM112013]|uniref:hypothetical protein n=1 Tax=Shimia sp. SDUM112013 TaxID=3136160 RepID=UPI0032F08BFD